MKEARPPEGPASPRDIIAAILTEAVPADDERRAFHVVYLACMALSLTDPAMLWPYPPWCGTPPW